MNQQSIVAATFAFAFVVYCGVCIGLDRQLKDEQYARCLEEVKNSRLWTCERQE